MTSIFKKTAWVAMTFLALLVALISLRFFVLDPEVAAGPPLGKRFAEYMTPLLFHAGGGRVALSLGAWGFWGAFRNKYLKLHRLLGRLYLMGVLVGGVSGFYMSFTAYGGLPARIGFGMLAVLWLASGTMAFLRIRRGNVQAHREWMIRNYAVTFSAVTLRLWLLLFIVSGSEVEAAYISVAWLSWVPNLLIAELIIGNVRAKAKSPQVNPIIAAINAA